MVRVLNSAPPNGEAREAETAIQPWVFGLPQTVPMDKLLWIYVFRNPLKNAALGNYWGGGWRIVSLVKRFPCPIQLSARGNRIGKKWSYGP